LSILDDIEKVRAVDPNNMYNRIFDLPEQMKDALEIGQKWKINPDEFSDIKNIVIIGMGGSAIGGDLIRTLFSSDLMVPFNVIRNYTLPEYVDDETLVIASSYSGNTEETLSALDDALERKAMIAAVSTGGILKDVCELNQVPLAVIPSGMQPRAALGYSFVPVLIFLEKIGLVKNIVDEIEKTIAHLTLSREMYIEDNLLDKNLAKQLADKIHSKMLIIYSGPTLTDTVAMRWKGQICENSKNMAFANHYAEFNHNELVGWADAVKEHKDNLIVFQLRDRDDHPQITKRMNIVKNIIEEYEIDVIDIQSKGENKIERMFYLIQLGDFVSYYLAVLNNADPSPVDVIMKLKKLLSE
jgi:glucose/mannose-6-phosphate isomerase